MNDSLLDRKRHTKMGIEKSGGKLKAIIWRGQGEGGNGGNTEWEGVGVG